MTKCNLVGGSIMENIQGDVSIKPLVFSCSYEFKGEGDLEEPYIQLYRSEYLIDSRIIKSIFD